MTDSPPANLRDTLQQADTLFGQGNKAGAGALYRSLPKLFGNDKRAISLAADGLLKCGFWSEAVDLYNQGLARYPVSPLFLGGLAEAYMAAGDYVRAADYLERNLARDASAENLTGLGFIQIKAGNWAAAETAFARALQVEPLAEGAGLGLGDSLMKLGRVDEAISAYRRVASVNPNNTQALIKLGTALTQPITAAEAEATLRRAIAIEPSNAVPYINLATAYLFQNKFAEATTWARKAVELAPNNENAHFILGVISLEVGDAAGALPALRRAAELEPREGAIMSAVAVTETLLDNLFAAELAWQIVLSIDPKNIAARHMLSALTGAAVTKMPDSYVAQEFDLAALRYDHDRATTYRAPQDVADLLSDRLSRVRRWLDVGCGTGLVASAFRNWAKFDTSIGIDLSARMIDVARLKNLYSNVIHGDAFVVMGELSEPFDLITAVDVFPYVGDLSGAMPAIARSLAPKGIFAYSAETLVEGTYKLEKTGRFGHSAAYIEKLASAAGLTPVARREVILRMERGRPVIGYVGLLEKAT